MDRTRLLVIHHDSSTRATLATLLKALGHDSVDAITPDAIYQMPPSRQALILFGLDLVGADDLGLMKFIRRNYPSVPVILLTTAIHPGRIGLSLRSSATSVLRFPLPASQLQAAVVQALDATDACSFPKAEQRNEPNVGGGASVNESPVRSDRTIATPPGATAPILPLKTALEGPEREIILHALRACGWKHAQAATALGIDRTTLYLKMKKPPVRSKRVIAAPPNATALILPLIAALEGPEREIILDALQACHWKRAETATALGISRSTLHKKMTKHCLFGAYGGRKKGVCSVPPRARVRGTPLRGDGPG